MMNKAAPKDFELVADHPVLDFINTLDNRFAPSGPLERLPQYADLLRFLEQAALLNGSQLKALRRQRNSAKAAQAMRVAHALRESLAQSFYGQLDGSGKPSPESLKLLQGHVRAAAAHQELTWERAAGHGGGVALRAGWQWAPHSVNLLLPVWVLAQSAVSLLTSPTQELVHQCQSDTCRWLFLDFTKNHSRRWCNMKVCGNRMKARRFRAQKA